MPLSKLLKLELPRLHLSKLLKPEFVPQFPYCRPGPLPQFWPKSRKKSPLLGLTEMCYYSDTGATPFSAALLLLWMWTGRPAL